MTKKHKTSIIMKPYIKRKSYLKRIKSAINNDLIKVFIGQRRVGKTYMLLQVADMIRKEDSNANIIFIDKELDKYDAINTNKDVIDFVRKHTSKENNVQNYVFIDEVQEIVDYHKALRSLRASGYDVYCTGSNASIISSDIATTLAGRYIEFEIHSLSYSEFLEFHSLEDGNESLMWYMRFGGLPYLKNLELKEDIVYEHLVAIYNTILFKDVATRHNVRNLVFIEDLVKYLAGNTGSLVSAKRIVDFLKSQKVKMSLTTIIEYLSFLTQAFFVSRVARYDVVGRKQFELHHKYYFNDLGLRHAIYGYRQDDINKVLENIVYLHLRYLGYNVSVGVLGEKEIDFVCKKGSEIVYVQVAYKIHDKNSEREFGNLLQIKDNYKKIVVSMDEFVGGATHNGVEHVSIREFLLKNKL